MEEKIKSGKFIAYFQSYTNTYAPIEYLERIFYQAISSEGVVALSVATRPDCLDAGVLSLLKELNKIKPVFVELGLQSIHEKTADFIRRGYRLSVFDEAVKNLKNIGVNVVVHVILGLPTESSEEMLQTVSYVGKSGADGIKLQLLHVLKGTDLNSLYLNGDFKCLEKDEYITLIGDAIQLLPKEIVIHRLTGDAPKKILVAPLWSSDKKSVLNAIRKSFDERDIIQGKKFYE